MIRSAPARLALGQTVGRLGIPPEVLGHDLVAGAEADAAAIVE